MYDVLFSIVNISATGGAISLRQVAICWEKGELCAGGATP